MKFALLSLLISLAVGSHFRNALAFRVDWQTEADILSQLVWRMPGLKPGTIILSEELPIRFASDNSLIAPLNWIYAPDFAPQIPLDRWYYDSISPTQKDFSLDLMPISLQYLELRLGTQLPGLSAGLPIDTSYRFYRFSSSTDAAIVIYIKKPYCLRVLHPIYDRLHPHFLGAEFYSRQPELLDPVLNPEFPTYPILTKAALHLSNLDQIDLKADPPAALPPQIFTTQSTSSWCFYFQKADLARQTSDWEQIAKLGDEAFLIYDLPFHASELVPFIEAYAHVDRWLEAKRITILAINHDGAMRAMLCDTWQRISYDVQSSDKKVTIISQINQLLSCSLS